MNHSRNEIRSPFLSVATGWVLGVWMRLWGITLRTSIEYRCQGPQTDGPGVFCLWHNRMIGGTTAARFWLKHREGVVLTSASKDGAIVSASMARVGLGAVRGSSHRRGAAALIALRKAIQKGVHVVVTPDGPKGPIYKMESGIVKLAAVTGAPIIPFLVSYESYWELNTWDRYMIPKPFSRVRVIFGEEMRVDPDVDEKGLELMRKKLELAMQEGLNWGDE